MLNKEQLELLDSEEFAAATYPRAVNTGLHAARNLLQRAAGDDGPSVYLWSTGVLWSAAPMLVIESWSITKGHPSRIAKVSEGDASGTWFWSVRIGRVNDGADSATQGSAETLADAIRTACFAAQLL